jgi:SPP1 family predicted phage head-tail adaptor
VAIEELQNLLDSNGDALQDNATGEVVREWVLVAEVSAAIEPLSAREFIASQSQQSRITARIVIRHRDGMHAAMRLVHILRGGARGTIYQPEGWLADKDSGLSYLTAPCSTGVNDQGQGPTCWSARTGPGGWRTPMR